MKKNQFRSGGSSGRPSPAPLDIEVRAMRSQLEDLRTELDHLSRQLIRHLQWHQAEQNHEKEEQDYEG